MSAKIESLDVLEVFVWFSNIQGEGMSSYLVEIGERPERDYFNPMPVDVAIRQALNQFMDGGAPGRVSRIEVRDVARQLIRARPPT